MANRPAAGEKYVRLEQAELTDKLFALFSEKPYWSIAALRQTLKQPDIWVREVLKGIADQVSQGTYINLWKLKEVWHTVDVKDDKDGLKGEGSEVDEDEDDDDEDLEEPDMEEVLPI